MRASAVRAPRALPPPSPPHASPWDVCDLGDRIVSVVRGRSDAVTLSAAARRPASELVDAANRTMAEETGVKGFSEPRLYKEWRNDLLANPGVTPAEWVRACADPGGTYLAWLGWRLDRPHHVSFRTVDAAGRRLGLANANLLVGIRWPQELAWARRIRRSPDDRDVLVGHRFLLAATLDPSAEFASVAGAFPQATDDPRYAVADEHGQTVDEIAAGHGSPAFGPLFLRHGRAALADRFDRMSPKDLRAGVLAARRAEELERAIKARRRAAAHVRSANMARSAGIIEVAMASGLDPDGLVEAQEEFAGLVASGAVPVPPDVGLPYEEFCAWLRLARPTGQSLLMPGDDLLGEVGLLDIMSAPLDWVRALPDDYRDMGGADPHVFHAWVAPIARRERAFPRDPVVDYGFHLKAAAPGRPPR